MTPAELTVRVPGDKSITHRALLLAALAEGDSRIARPLQGADTESTAAALRRLGIGVSSLADGDVLVRGDGLDGLRRSVEPIDCGNSGTTARLLMGVLASHAFDSVLTGDASLRARPMRRVTTPLTQMGARFEELEQPDRLPIRVHGGALRPMHYASPHASAQVKSAILLAGLGGRTHVSVTEPLQSRDHTERLLAHLGVAVQARTLPDGRHEVSLAPATSLPPFEMAVPGDFSSAAFVLAVGCLSADRPIRIHDVGVNPTRTGFLDVLRRMGATIETRDARATAGEPIADLVVRRSSLQATHVGGEEVPRLIDELPVIAVLAARAHGTTTIEGAAELRIKESDRIAAIVSNLRALGVNAVEHEDGFTVEGTDRPLAGRVRTRDDHRIAMAFGILAAVENGIELDATDAVAVSFPGFWTMLRDVAPALRP